MGKLGQSPSGSLPEPRHLGLYLRLCSELPHRLSSPDPEKCRDAGDPVAGCQRGLLSLEGGCAQGSSPAGAEPGGRRATAGHAGCPLEQGKGSNQARPAQLQRPDAGGPEPSPGGQSPVQHSRPVAPWACSCPVSWSWSGSGPSTALCGQLAQGGQQAPVSRTVEGCGHSRALRAMSTSVVLHVHAALEQFQAGAGMSPCSGQEGRTARSSLGLGSSGSTCWDRACSPGSSLPDFSSPRHPSLCPHPKAEDTAAGASPRASIGEPASGLRRGRPSAGGPGIENPEGRSAGMGAGTLQLRGSSYRGERTACSAAAQLRSCPRKEVTKGKPNG